MYMVPVPIFDLVSSLISKVKTPTMQNKTLIPISAPLFERFNITSLNGLLITR